VVDAVAATATNLDGGRLDVVLRIGRELRHAWCARADADQPGKWDGGGVIRATVWLAAGASVHRR
jgi:hypothetical protein